MTVPSEGRHSDGVTVQDWVAVTEHSVWGETLETASISCTLHEAPGAQALPIGIRIFG